MEYKLISYIFGLISGGFLAYLGHIFSKNRERDKEFREAALEFRKAFIAEIVKFERSKPFEIEGTKIYAVLERAYSNHYIAVHKFRIHLDMQKRIGFDRAWKQYQYPDDNDKRKPFDFYISINGSESFHKPDFVLDKIYSLLTYASP